MFGPSRRVARRTARRTSRRQMAMRDMYDEPAYDEPAAAPPPAPAEPDLAGQLQELAKLKDQGILTEEEFQAKKKQILDI
jgi:Short C-terminal domain